MHLPKDNFEKRRKVPQKSIFVNIGSYIKSLQLESGSIPSNEDGSHDPWDHIESILGLNFSKELNSSKSAFTWLINNQNSDGSWFSKYDEFFK